MTTVAILGAGAIALASAAVLAERGHRARIWSPTGRTTAELAAAGAVTAVGRIAGTFPIEVAEAIGDAVAGADAVLLALPGNVHHAAIDRLAAVAIGGRPIIVSSMSSLSALYLSRRLVERGVAAPIIAWGTTAVTGRRSGAAAVNVMTLRTHLDVATLPARDIDSGLATCRALFGDRFGPRADVLAIALTNINPIAHMALALCNITRIERGEAWPQYHYMSDTVSRLIEALDAERLALAAAFGLEVRTIHEHFHLSFDIPLGPLAEIARTQHARRGGPPGPTSLDTRFVLEDVPFGIVPAVALAKAAGVEVPLHEAGLALCSALYGRDFAADNDLLEPLGIAQRPAADTHAMARDGWKA